MNNSTTHAFAVETDTKLSELYLKRNQITSMIDQHAARVRRAAGQRYSQRDLHWSGTWQEALDEIARFADTPTYASISANDSITKHDALSVDLRVLDAEIESLEVIWRQHRWSRFFLVLNNNGHVHSSMSCSTCRFDTAFGWLPQLSGLTEVEAVADQGEILCSVCFPSAPVAWTTGESKRTKEAKAARAAAKEASAAARRAKQLFDDGHALVVDEGSRFPERITTIAAAKTWLTDWAEWTYQLSGHAAYSTGDAVRVAEALAERVGGTSNEQLEAAKVRAAKRQRR